MHNKVYLITLIMKADYKIAPHPPKREIFSLILLRSEAVMLLAY